MYKFIDGPWSSLDIPVMSWALEKHFGIYLLKEVCYVCEDIFISITPSDKWPEYLTMGRVKEFRVMNERVTPQELFNTQDRLFMYIADADITKMVINKGITSAEFINSHKYACREWYLPDYDLRCQNVVWAQRYFIPEGSVINIPEQFKDVV